MRRVLFVTQTAHPWGGVETWLEQLTKMLERNGWHCVVGLARGRHFHDPVRYRKARPNMRTIELDGRAGTREACVGSIVRAIDAVSPDIVVPVSLVAPIEATARAKLAGRPVRLVVAVRSLSHGVLADLREFADFIDLGVGLNRLLERLLREYVGLPDSRSRYIPHARAPDAKVRSPRTSRFRLGYIGRLEERDKRVMDLVPVVRSLDARGIDYELLIVGDGTCRTLLEKDLRATAEAGRIRFLGVLSPEALHARVYPNLDCLLLFSPAEGGPRVVWEAMHHGVVPVSSRYRGCGAENVLRHRETALLFEVGKPERAAELVAELCGNADLLAKLSRAGQAAVQARPTLDAWRDAWLGALNDAMTLPVAVGAALPVREASGRLERWGVPARLAALLRALTARSPRAREPGGEWPHCGSYDARLLGQIDVLAAELDHPQTR